MRFDDPFESSKSSIWTNPDTKNNHVGSSNGRLAFFGGLQQAKGVNYESRNLYQSFEGQGSSMVLQANPAAFLRSLALHEITRWEDGEISFKLQVIRSKGEECNEHD